MGVAHNSTTPKDPLNGVVACILFGVAALISLAAFSGTNLRALSPGMPASKFQTFQYTLGYAVVFIVCLPFCCAKALALPMNRSTVQGASSNDYASAPGVSS